MLSIINFCWVWVLSIIYLCNSLILHSNFSFAIWVASLILFPNIWCTRTRLLIHFELFFDFSFVTNEIVPNAPSLPFQPSEKTKPLSQLTADSEWGKEFQLAYQGNVNLFIIFSVSNNKIFVIFLCFARLALFRVTTRSPLPLFCSTTAVLSSW